jgi:anti-anti-sigma regulatory factor
MAGLFSSLCNEPVSLRFSGADRLVDTLRTMMPSGDRSVSPDWWAMRLNALRTLKLLDDFELAALDYCVTYEVSPPPWQEARCEYENVEEVDTPPSAPAPIRVEAASGWGSGFSQMATAPIGLDGSNAIKLELKGEVLGDATQALAGFDTTGHTGDGIVVSCRGLIRVDFSAAGSILNWVAMRQAEGCHIQFRDVHRLVAAFFNVIGINEHARVVPRPI